MPAGEVFSSRQQEEINRAIALAERQSGLHYAAYVGPTQGAPREYARSLLRSLADPGRSVLTLVDPSRRALEIVTGNEAALRLDDRDCSLAAMTMASTFNAGDLAGGIATGILQLADHARRPRSLHLDQP